MTAPTHSNDYKLIYTHMFISLLSLEMDHGEMETPIKIVCCVVNSISTGGTTNFKMDNEKRNIQSIKK